MEIKYAKNTDLAAIAQCHISAFPDALSSAMGKKYVEKMLEWYISGDKMFLFYIEENKKCVGYCGGIISDGTLPTGAASGMIQHSFSEAVNSLLMRPWLLVHKELRKKYSLALKNIKLKIKNKLFKPKKSLSGKKKIAEPQVGLVVIGVRPEYHGKGYGSKLLQEFERFSGTTGIKKLQLSVIKDNLKAIRSYERNGWQRAEIHGNSLTMYKYLDK